VPIEKLRRLCKAIIEEDDPEALTHLIAGLTEHLQHDQNAIKAKISQFKRRSQQPVGNRHHKHFKLEEKTAPTHRGHLRRRRP
jgi:hypothetical protein